MWAGVERGLPQALGATCSPPGWMLSHGILTAPLELAACNRETKAEAMPAAYDATMQEGEADCYEFQASLGYIVSFRPAWSI